MVNDKTKAEHICNTFHRVMLRSVLWCMFVEMHPQISKHQKEKENKAKYKYILSCLMLSPNNKSPNYFYLWPSFQRANSDFYNLEKQLSKDKAETKMSHLPDPAPDTAQSSDTTLHAPRSPQQPLCLDSLLNDGVEAQAEADQEGITAPRPSSQGHHSDANGGLPSGARAWGPWVLCDPWSPERTHLPGIVISPGPAPVRWG